MKRLKINTCNKPGKVSFFLRSEINTWNQPGQLSHRPTFSSSRLIPVASQGNISGWLIVDQHLKPARKTIYMKRLKINTCNKPGKLSFFLRSEINTWNQTGKLSRRPTFSSSRLILVASQENYLWTTDCRLIPVTRQENYLSFSGQRLIPETRQDNYLLDHLKQPNFPIQFRGAPNTDAMLAIIQFQLIDTV